MSRSFGDLTIALRAGDGGGSVNLIGKKALVVHGVTVGADGVIVTGAKRPVMEVQIEGLAPGPHTFVGYHHALKGAAGTYSISVGDQTIEGIKPSEAPCHNDGLRASFIEL